ncbi:hypothetical protein LINPERHAP2_LOCUS9965 [Linum perenne]
MVHRLGIPTTLPTSSFNMTNSRTRRRRKNTPSSATGKNIPISISAILPFPNNFAIEIFGFHFKIEVYTNTQITLTINHYNLNHHSNQSLDLAEQLQPWLLSQDGSDPRFSRCSPPWAWPSGSAGCSSSGT